MASNEGISVDLKNIPIVALKTSTRNKLGEMLDTEKLSTEDGLSRDWRGLAELVGFDDFGVTELANTRHPTVRILHNWQSRGMSSPSIGHLLSLLEQIGRFDVIDDMKTKLEADGREYLEKVIQDAAISSATENENTITNDELILTTSDATHLANTGTVQTFDAYVSCTEEDQDFLKELINELEKRRNLKLFIKDRDMLGGVFEHSANIDLIQKRCRRMLIVMSPAFLKSPLLNWQFLFAQALSIEEQKRRIIPVIYEQCQLPPKFRFLASLNYAKRDIFEIFWPRLAQSIIGNPLHVPPIAPEAASQNGSPVLDSSRVGVLDTSDSTTLGAAAGDSASVSVPDTNFHATSSPNSSGYVSLTESCSTELQALNGGADCSESSIKANKKKKIGFKNTLSGFLSKKK